MCLNGKSIKEISNKTGYCERTINRRKKDIYYTINKYMN